MGFMIFDDGYVSALFILWGFLIIAFPIAIIVGIVKAWKGKDE
jgi:hypothetical protein